MDTAQRFARSVLVIGEYRQTVTVVRSLARAGLRVTLACTEPDSPTRYSRHVSGVWLYDGTRMDRFAAQVEAYLRQHPHDFVFTVGESPLRRLIEAAERLEPLSTWVNPAPATVARCFDKAALYAITPSLGIPTPPWCRYSEPDEWRERARVMGFPVVIKRLDSSAHVRDHKAIICREPAELESFLATVERDPDPGSLLLQKFHPGRRRNCHVAFADGRLVAYFEQEVLSTDDHDDTGIGTCGISVPPTGRLRGHCEQLGAALRYTGIGCIQFLLDARGGRAGFLEFNARMDSTAALPYRLGYDYPRLAVELAQFRRGKRGPPAAVTRPYPAGVKYHWLLGDLWAFVGDARAGYLPPRALAAWAVRMAWRCVSSHHLTFDWRDPMPTLVMYWQHLGRRLARRLHVPPMPAKTG
jgi:biotin carboxylase